MSACTVVALGGNAILGPRDRGTVEEQRSTIKKTAATILRIAQAGSRVVITHGNGPQIGAILIQNESGKKSVPSMPVDVCVAETQGMLGYMITQALRNEAKSRRVSIEIATILTQTVVRKNDPAFHAPSKPVGPFYGRAEAQILTREKGYKMIEDAGRGWRRVLPSPDPREVLEAKAIEKLVSDGFIVIANGGGGIPVVREGRRTRGVEAVVDKDLSSQTLASQIRASALILLTDVTRVYLNYGQPNQTKLDKITTREAKKYLSQGHFLAGSMEPKVRAAVRFVESGGRFAAIGALDDAFEVSQGKLGTQVVRAI